MIRDFELEDILAFESIHRENGLPGNCLPEFQNPLFVVKRVFEPDGVGKPAMGVFVKITGEVYLLLDHSIGTPKQRWDWLTQVTKDMQRQAHFKGLDQISAWIPDDIEETFGKRLLSLGFQKSPWVCYTLPVDAI